MKKTKMLIATLVCAVMLMGVGYAWWYDTLTLGADVQAGNMDVNWVINDVYPIYEGLGYATVELDESSGEKDLKFKFNNLYPGAIAFVDAVAVNDSTIPVTLKEVTLSPETGNALFDNIKTCGYIYRTKRVGEKDQYIGNSFKVLPYASLSKLGTNIANALGNVTLNPGDKIFFGIPKDTGEEEINTDIEGYEGNEECIIFIVDTDAKNEIQNQETSFELKFDWKQFNDLLN